MKYVYHTTSRTHEFVSEEDMTSSGKRITDLLEDMNKLANQLKTDVASELAYAKGEISKMSIREASIQLDQQQLIVNGLMETVTFSTRVYNRTYNEIGKQPIRITYKVPVVE